MRPGDYAFSREGESVCLDLPEAIETALYFGDYRLAFHYLKLMALNLETSRLLVDYSARYQEDSSRDREMTRHRGRELEFKFWGTKVADRYMKHELNEAKAVLKFAEAADLNFLHSGLNSLDMIYACSLVAGFKLPPEVHNLRVQYKFAIGMKKLEESVPSIQE
ncbi:MAG: hypothetical protein HYX24_06885 [Candidatus Aenigmarchaeota archaeon]|nr:hypothetical protein [Candidatus Aenigmarchaeota archaeon]